MTRIDVATRRSAVAIDGVGGVDEADGVVHVRNAPSPGATSSLAIAEVIADRVEAASVS